MAELLIEYEVQVYQGREQHRGSYEIAIVTTDKAEAMGVYAQQRIIKARYVQLVESIQVRRVIEKSTEIRWRK